MIPDEQEQKFHTDDRLHFMGEAVVASRSQALKPLSAESPLL